MAKSYQWEGVLWPEHFPALEDAKASLINFGVKGYISPIQNDDGGKEHFHFIWCFDRQKTYEQVMNMIQDEGLGECINTVKYVKDLTTRARYLCHLDESSKSLYDPNDVTCMGGTDYYQFLNVSSEKYNDDMTLMEIIKKYNVGSYAQLVDYCMYCSREHYKSVVGRCGFWSAYLRSKVNDSRSHELQNIIDETRGKKDESELY